MRTSAPSVRAAAEPAAGEHDPACQCGRTGSGGPERERDVRAARRSARARVDTTGGGAATVVVIVIVTRLRHEAPRTGLHPTSRRATTVVVIVVITRLRRHANATRATARLHTARSPPSRPATSRAPLVIVIVIALRRCQDSAGRRGRACRQGGRGTRHGHGARSDRSQENPSDHQVHVGSAFSSSFRGTIPLRPKLGRQTGGPRETGVSVLS